MTPPLLLCVAFAAFTSFFILTSFATFTSLTFVATFTALTADRKDVPAS
ncbi:hypothetical protein ACWD5Q_29225 [Streptomyces sp. NPDC002513]